MSTISQTELFIYLNSINEDYAKRCLKLIEGVTPILNTIHNVFPFYTQHNAIHSAKIVHRIGHILKSECLKSNSAIALSGVGVYLLICSAYTHDLGMAIFPDEDQTLCDRLGVEMVDDWRSNARIQQYLRLEHSKRGIDYLDKNKIELEIPSSLLVHLDYMMRAHNEPVQDLKSGLLKKYAADEQQINLPQLASVLCIADALEFSEARVLDGVVDQIREKLESDRDESILISYRENMKHLCIGGNLAVMQSGEIVVTAVFDDADVLNLAHKTFDDIEKWLQEYLDIDNYFQTPLTRIRNHVIYRSLDFKNGHFERLGIRIKKDNVINLISSNSIWNNGGSIVLKELLQNSVEACRYRKFLSSSADNYKPNIILRFDDVNRQIILEDNGCGMTTEVILNNLLTVGNSRADSLEYRRGNYSSIARFGIGFWSCFIIADNVSVSTRSFLNDAPGVSFDVSIKFLKDYITFKNDDLPLGTRIVLNVKKDFNFNELHAQLYNHLICSEIPIQVLKGARSTIIGPDIVLPTEMEIYGPKILKAKENHVSTFIWKENTFTSDLKMYLSYSNRQGQTSFLLKNGQPVNSLHVTSFGLRSRNAICGFAVNFAPVYTPFHTAVGEYLTNNKNPSGFIFNINRRSLLQSKEYSDHLNEISLFLNRGYFQFLQFSNSLGLEDVYRLNSESKKSVSGGIGFDDVQIDIAIKEFPELLVYKLHKIEQSKTKQNCLVEYYNVNDIVKVKRRIISYKPFYSHHQLLHVDERKSEFVYDLLKSINVFENCFFHEWNDELQLLYNRNDKSYVYKVKIQFNGDYLWLPFIVIDTDNIQLGIHDDKFYGRIQGTWSGSITFKEIEGSNFAFSYNAIVIKPNCKLADDVKSWYDDGEYIKLADLFNLLAMSESGHIDEAIVQYM